VDRDTDYLQNHMGIEVCFTAKNISYRLPRGGRSLIRDLSLKLTTGHRLAIWGENGSGKTTLLKIFAGNIRVGAGQIEIDQKGGKASPFEVPELCGFISAESTYPKTLTINALIRIMPWLCERWDKSLEGELHSSLAIDNDWRAGHLSAGESTRFQLLVALASNCPVVLIDESLSSIDHGTLSKWSNDFIAVLKNGRILIYSTHNWEHVLRFGTHVLITNDLGFSEGAIEIDKFMRGWVKVTSSDPTQLGELFETIRAKGPALMANMSLFYYAGALHEERMKLMEEQSMCETELADGKEVEQAMLQAPRATNA
jgi:ABC-type multidrug transport system ATPase subunit